MTFDLIVIGGGHNGLTTAALVAGHGRKVLVLERRDVVGGLAADEEFHPGYRSVGILHDSATVRPSVIGALGLEVHGLRRCEEPTPVFAPQADGPGLLLHADAVQAAAELRTHASGDAERYEQFGRFIQRIRGYVTGLLSEPPPEVMPRGLAQHWKLLRKGLAFRRLGRETMYECMRVGPMSAADWLDECFEGDLLKATLAAPGLLGTFSGPRSAGTAALVLMHQCTSRREIVGGPAALVGALSAACERNGVSVRTGVGVRRIAIRDGQACGVELDSGETIDAPAIAASTDPRQTFLDLITPAQLPPGLAEPIGNWRCRGTTAKLHLALDGPLEFACRPGTSFAAVRIGEDLTQLERAFDGVKYGELPEAPHLDIRVPTIADPSLAPVGHHVASILVHFVPRDLAGGWTVEAREALLRRCLARLSSVSPTCTDRVVGHQLLTPEDLERDHRLTGGHIHHGEHGLDQLFSLRPHAHCARYRTPLPGLFLCGSGSHPGGGITCAPGALAAAVI